MTNNQKTTFIKGAMILASAGLISRFLGLFYRIVLTRLIGMEGVGLYHLVYPVYTILLVVSVSGIPVALGKLISEKLALGQNKEAYRVFIVARNLSVGIGGGLTVLLILTAKPLIAFLNLDTRSYFSILALAPAILIVSIMSAYRGYFQGMQNMVPTAISQIVEQVVRMIIIVVLPFYLLPYGLDLAVAGATFSAVTGAIVGLMIILIIFYRQKQKIYDAKIANEEKGSPVSVIIKQIINLAVPVVIAASVVQLMSLIMVIFVPQRLQTIGYSVAESTIQYGELTTGLVLVQFLNVFTSALQTSLIPSISTAYALGLSDIIRQRTTTALRITLIIGIASSVGLYLLAEPLSTIIFGAPEVAIPLRFLAWGVIFTSIQQATSGILQGIGKVNISAQNLLIGAGVNALLSYTLTSIPELGIKGAAIGTVMGFATAALLNTVILWKSIRFSFNFYSMLLKPVIAAGVMALAVIFSYGKLTMLLSVYLARGSEVICTLGTVGIGAIVFLGVFLGMRGLTRQELSLIPGIKFLTIQIRKLKVLVKEE